MLLLFLVLLLTLNLSAGFVCTTSIRPCHLPKRSAVNDDPFRPEKASLDPLCINTLVKELFRSDGEPSDGGRVEKALRERDLEEAEVALVASQVQGVLSLQGELRFMLATAVSRNSFIAKYGMESEYGMSEDLETSPLTQLRHAECLLALYRLHKDADAPLPVDFLDEEIVGVLTG
ncbi:unnamed protein product [Chrysoparadoxa australica]